MDWPILTVHNFGRFILIGNIQRNVFVANTFSVERRRKNFDTANYSSSSFVYK